MDNAGVVGIGTGILDSGLTVSETFANALPTHRHIFHPKLHSYALFSKIANTAPGSLGIFTYDLLKNSTNESTERIVIMYKVLSNLNLKSNAYALGVFSVATECDRHLFHEMSKSTNTTFVRGLAKGPSLAYKSGTVTIRATVSNCYTPVMKVQVSEELSCLPSEQSSVSSA
uniref:Uncharacterized protein n=1 Tax=Mola mola TaxID=94237 RepID=A0A3Q3WIS5_MOLML